MHNNMGNLQKNHKDRNWKRSFDESGTNINLSQLSPMKTNFVVITTGA